MIALAEFELLHDWLQALKPPPIIRPSDFAESEIVLPSSSAARPGPLRLSVYQREIVNSIADPSVEIVVLMLASQVGKSLSVESMLAHCIGCDPGAMLHVSPTAANAEAFVRNRFDPLVGASQALRTLVGKGQATRKGSAGGVDSKSSKTFPGGQLDFASSHKADELAARAIKFLFLDEVDRFARSVGVEGCPVDLAIKRTTTFRNAGRKIVIVSTPTSRVGSRINQWFLRGDQRRFFLTCLDPHCKYSAPASFANLKWEPGRPEQAILVCEECGTVHDEVARRSMIARGEWRATAAGEPGVRSYHLNELVSEFSNLAAVARQAEAAKTPGEKQVFYNTALAEVYDAGTEVELSAETLEQRAERIESPYDFAIAYVTAGTDVQSDRLEVSFVGHAEDGQAWVLNHLKLPGDTSADAVWRDLDAALGATFTTADGRILTVEATAVDSGFAADQVVKFVLSQRRKSRRAVPVKGVSGFDRPAFKIGGKLKGTMRLALIGVDGMKLTVAKRLATEEVGPSFIHLPSHLPPEYFDQLAAEQLRTKANRNGFLEYAFFKTARNNEALDTLVYALAIAGTVQTPTRRRQQQPRRTISEMAAALNRLHNSQNG